MALFDFFLFEIVIKILGTISEVFDLLLIYTIWQHSPSRMSQFRFFMLKMTIADLTFTFCCLWLFQPNLLFPLPACTVYGPLRYLGPNSGKIAAILCLGAGLVTLLSVNDACIARWMIINKKDAWLRHWSGIAGAVFYILYNGFWILVLATVIYFSACDFETLKAYALRHGRKEIAELGPDSPLLAFDVDDKRLLVSGGVIIGGLIYNQVFIVLLSQSVHKKITEAKGSMSTETYKMQHSLTVILLLQATVPCLCMSIPVIGYIFAFLFDWPIIYESQSMMFLSVVLVGGYPFLNGVLCVSLMRPYRMFFVNFYLRLFGRRHEPTLKVSSVSLHHMDSRRFPSSAGELRSARFSN